MLLSFDDHLDEQCVVAATADNFEDPVMPRNGPNLYIGQMFLLIPRLLIPLRHKCSEQRHILLEPRSKSGVKIEIQLKAGSKA
jgi:hypothetical protein